jgi:hypothetical protein
MCNKTSKTIEYCKIFLRWIIKRAHGNAHATCLRARSRNIDILLSNLGQATRTRSRVASKVDKTAHTVMQTPFNVG